MRSTTAFIAAALLTALPFVPLEAGNDALPLRAAGLTEPGGKKLSAREAGTRYGEAAGAALVCNELRITPRVADLRAGYQGDDLAEFDEQAGKILQAWREARDCQHAEGPNDCKISQQWSCRQAVQEIGPSGTALRGLVEPKE